MYLCLYDDDDASNLMSLNLSDVCMAVVTIPPATPSQPPPRCPADYFCRDELQDG